MLPPLSNFKLQNRALYMFVRKKAYGALTPNALPACLVDQWFAVANRSVIFLYAHLGATPFDERTRSRYWMARPTGCAARLAGIGYRRYDPPLRQQLWLGCALPVTIGILVITMNYNVPTLPPRSPSPM